MLIAAVYYALGGFEKPGIQIVNVGNYYLAGNHYSGKYNSRELGDLFEKYRRIIGNGETKGILTIINNKEAEADGRVDYSIGILTDPRTWIRTDSSMQMITIKASRAVRVTIAAHNLVMPDPGEVRESVEAFAVKEGLKLEGYSIEKYISDRNLEIDFPVKQ